ncbi:MAG: hypothetical protein H6712_31150 [Myxococcales bacterium]|nr:hypothetical protein [Myxococcales bacterium]MCB9718349.1 hypothetical protein [Myxococcales bacterium]
MRPWIVLAVLALGCDHRDAPVASPGLAEPLACRAQLDPEELLPPDALIVGHYDMARERRFAPEVSKADAAGPRALVPSSTAEAARLVWVGLAAACELDEDFLEGAWVAMDREEEVTVVLSGEGIGGERELRCIQRRLARYQAELLDPEAIVADGCGLRLRGDDWEGFAPHDDLLVVGTAEAVAKARLAWSSGRGSPPRHLLPGRRSRSTYVWAAVDVAALLSPEEIDRALREASTDPTPFIDLRTVELEAKLGRRYSLHLGGRFGNEADARGAAAAIQALLDAPPPRLPGWAIEMLERVELEHEDAAVEVSVTLQRRRAHELGLLPEQTEARQAPALPWLLLALGD